MWRKQVVTDAVFDVQNVTYRYNSDVTALNGITLAIERGTRVAILGANGSGKSTLLRILDGLYFPEGGSVTAFGERLPFSEATPQPPIPRPSGPNLA
jgi:cobalt/nickel transport system ATP-binding protein